MHTQHRQQHSCWRIHTCAISTAHPCVHAELLLHELTSTNPPPPGAFGSTTDMQKAWLARLQPLYSQAMELELKFFNAQPGCQELPKVRVGKSMVKFENAFIISLGGLFGCSLLTTNSTWSEGHTQKGTNSNYYTCSQRAFLT